MAAEPRGDQTLGGSADDARLRLRRGGRRPPLPGHVSALRDGHPLRAARRRAASRNPGEHGRNGLLHRRRGLQRGHRHEDLRLPGGLRGQGGRRPPGADHHRLHAPQRQRRRHQGVRGSRELLHRDPGPPEDRPHLPALPRGQRRVHRGGHQPGRGREGPPVPFRLPHADALDVRRRRGGAGADIENGQVGRGDHLPGHLAAGPQLARRPRRLARDLPQGAALRGHLPAQHRGDLLHPAPRGIPAAQRAGRRAGADRPHRARRVRAPGRRGPGLGLPGGGDKGRPPRLVRQDRVKGANRRAGPGRASGTVFLGRAGALVPGVPGRKHRQRRRFRGLLDRRVPHRPAAGPPAGGVPAAGQLRRGHEPAGHR
jgi:hypothetical protein